MENNRTRPQGLFQYLWRGHHGAGIDVSCDCECFLSSFLDVERNEGVTFVCVLMILLTSPIFRWREMQKLAIQKVLGSSGSPTMRRKPKSSLRDTWLTGDGVTVNFPIQRWVGHDYTMSQKSASGRNWFLYIKDQWIRAGINSFLGLYVGLQDLLLLVDLCHMFTFIHIHLGLGLGFHTYKQGF